jgi:serine/threonine protein phosphatase PrpC
MSTMSYIAYLVDTQNKKELTEFLLDKGFKNPEFAANEFLKAGKEIKERDNAKVSSMRLQPKEG